MFHRIAERPGKRRLGILSRKHLAAAFEEFRRDPRGFGTNSTSFPVQIIRRAAGPVSAVPGIFLKFGECMDLLQELICKPVAAGPGVLEHAAEIGPVREPPHDHVRTDRGKRFRRSLTRFLEANGCALNREMRLTLALGRIFTYVPRLPKHQGLYALNTASAGDDADDGRSPLVNAFYKALIILLVVELVLWILIRFCNILGN